MRTSSRPWAALALALTGYVSACSSTSTGAVADAGPDATQDSPSPAKLAMPQGDPLSWAVDAVGPFNVGHRSFEFTYAPPLLPGAPPRTIPIDLWYPTLDTEGGRTVYRGVFGDPDVLEGASAAPPMAPGGYPVHVYSHGSSGFGGTSSDMAHWFVSHGWVYVAPNHVGNLLGDPEGKKALSLSYLRAADVTAALDAVEKLAAPDPLAGKLRTRRVLLSGHSFGAYTTWATGGVTFDTKALKSACDLGEFLPPCTPEEIAIFGKNFGDPRVAALVPMAGRVLDWIADYDAPRKPTLLMSGSLDVPGGPIFERARELDLTWLDFEGGCHQLFALGGCKTLDETLGWKLTNTWALAWGRRYVLGDASDRTTRIVTGALPLSPLITLKHKGVLTPPSGP